MFGMSFGHLLILLVVVLLLFGARRLPELGGALGKGLRAFKKGLDGADDQPQRLDAPRDNLRERDNVTTAAKGSEKGAADEVRSGHRSGDDST